MHQLRTTIRTTNEDVLHFLNIVSNDTDVGWNNRQCSKCRFVIQHRNSNNIYKVLNQAEHNANNLGVVTSWPPVLGTLPNSNLPTL
jgi:hypothetical protein